MTQSLSNTFVCFDLDDTLYPETDFLKSGYREIAKYISSRYDIDTETVFTRMLEFFEAGTVDVFSKINDTYRIGCPIDEYLKIYREHKPDILLSKDVRNTLSKLKEIGCILGIITDGRSITQRNKIDALGLDEWFDNENIIISEEFGLEKPSLANYQYFMSKYPEHSFWYIGDNPYKDFIGPRKLNWRTAQVSSDSAIHHRRDSFEAESQPEFLVSGISQITEIICL